MNLQQLLEICGKESSVDFINGELVDKDGNLIVNFVCEPIQE